MIDKGIERPFRSAVVQDIEVFQWSLPFTFVFSSSITALSLDYKPVTIFEDSMNSTSSFRPALIDHRFMPQVVWKRVMGWAERIVCVENIPAYSERVFPHILFLEALKIHFTKLGHS